MNICETCGYDFDGDKCINCEYFGEPNNNNYWEHQTPYWFEPGEYHGNNVWSPKTLDIIGKVSPINITSIDEDAKKELTKFWHKYPDLRKECLNKYGYDPIDEELNYWKYGLGEPEHSDIKNKVESNGGVFTLEEAKRWEKQELKASKKEKTAEFGMTDFRDFDNDIEQGDPKYDLDPMYKQVGESRPEFNTLRELHPELTHEELIDLLRRKGQPHHYDHTDQDNTLYMFEPDIHTQFSHVEDLCPNCGTKEKWGINNDECLRCGYKFDPTGFPQNEFEDHPAYWEEQYMFPFISKQANEVADNDSIIFKIGFLVSRLTDKYSNFIADEYMDHFSNEKWRLGFDYGLSYPKIADDRILEEIYKLTLMADIDIESL